MIEVPSKIQKLWEHAEKIWTRFENDPAFGSYVSADYTVVFQELNKMKGKTRTFLEMGSGLGVVTIMAASLGYEAYGIEAESKLVDLAADLTLEYDESVEFAVGSFIPDEFQWDPGEGHESIRTFIDIPGAYGELGMELDEFDLIYAYPWPTEHPLYWTVLENHARRGAYFLSYDAREGIDVKAIEESKTAFKKRMTKSH